MSGSETAIVPPVLLDLAQRLRERAATLDRMADQHRDYVERARLWGKAGGVELALSFVLEAIRDAENGSEDLCPRCFAADDDPSRRNPLVPTCPDPWHQRDDGSTREADR